MGLEFDFDSLIINFTLKQRNLQKLQHNARWSIPSPRPPMYALVEKGNTLEESAEVGFFQAIFFEQ